ncbi:prolipoprotein diacylglyceryl transferase [Nocardia aurantiaca]|uniref:Phosphatidylglycerol--prolipoprotein diacylglyceryl transferase n=1 Tax=Nocardia aurantiaca TaxID=2675850 RepID=A0A6I3KZP2_9NOCA|nr:prolipoprotein diacylglyceryl transferase [Nocardia aurantiaca]MTE13906.1 prolipoprotein diacylglyceryl transferase [Nocardia aurantiaca]
MTLRALAESTGADVLAYIPSPPRGVWYIGPFPLRAYAICIILGIITAIWLGEKRWVARGGQSGMVLDVAMFAVPFGLIGGRLYHVATDWQKYFGANGHPMNALKIWEGGLGIWGAVLLGGVGAWIGCRVYRIPLPAFGDAIAPGILLAQAIGRLGNYFNQELYGRETTVPWGLEIYQRFDHSGGLDMMNGTAAGAPIRIVQPTFLYELIWNLAGVAVLLYLDRKFRIGHGRLFALYVAIYCFGRFFVELLRDDEATHIAGIRINSFTSAIVFICAVAYLLFATKGRETAEQVRAGVQRPWPWQLGALRAYGAAGAAAESEATASEKTEPAEAGAAENDIGSESPAPGNESEMERDNSSEPDGIEPEETEASSADPAKPVESGKNGS